MAAIGALAMAYRAGRGVGWPVLVFLAGSIVNVALVAAIAIMVEG